MQRSPIITFRGVHAAPILEADIRRRLARLERFAARVTGAQVWVELVGRHHHRGNQVRVRIELLVPGGAVVVRHDVQPSGRAAARSGAIRTVRKGDEIAAGHRHAKVAIREAFETARRRLQDYVRRQRLDVKTPAPRSRRAARPGVAAAATD
jgi:hypothetical protein